MAAKKYEVVKATYTKENGEVSERELIVATSPSDNYMAYDVALLDEAQRQELIDLLTRHKEELKAFPGASIKQFKAAGLTFAN